MVNKIVIPTKAGISSLICLVLLFSCNQKTFNTEEELISFIQDETNGYKQQKMINGVNFSLLYRPTDLLVKQEISDKKVTKEELKELKNKYKKYIYLNLSMSKNNQELLSTIPKNRNEFGQMVNQLAFGMRDRVHVFNQSKDTLEMVDFVYPRMYGMSKSTSIMFVYPRDKEKLQDDYINFTVQDIGLYTGEVKFKIDIEKIENEPQLAL
ncbi:MAG: hypothetical protein HRT67_06560 [Flavobacteriaceae bacterium]|nr:hypothetical protein [Flavobacteriaceae bacterium]